MLVASPETPHPTPTLPVPVQILTTIFYAGFAISVSIVAMAMFGLIGLILAALFAWQWTRVLSPAPSWAAADAAPATVLEPTGNAHFDAYRDDILTRLEDDRAEFETYLTRLRAARDQTEFDGFLAERAWSTGTRHPNPTPVSLQD